MRILKISVANFDDKQERINPALNGVIHDEHISFETFEQLWSILSPPRVTLLRAMLSKEAMSLNAAGRLTGQVIEAIHDDVEALLDARLLEKDDRGQIRCPYDMLHVDFTG